MVRFWKVVRGKGGVSDRCFVFAMYDFLLLEFIFVTLCLLVLLLLGGNFFKVLFLWLFGL